MRTVIDLSLMINKILNDEKLKNELENLENKEQIYDFFAENGYEDDYDEFCIGMEEIFDLFDLFEVSDDDLDYVAGGIGGSSGKVAATFLSILSLVGGVPSVNAKYVPNSTAVASINNNVQNNEVSFDDSFLNSFFSSENKGFFISLKSKFFEKANMVNFIQIDKLISKLKSYYQDNKNDLSAKIVSNTLFTVIKIIESKNPENNAVKQKVVEAKSALKPIASKLKNDEKISPQETLSLIKKVEQLYFSAGMVQKDQKSKKFKSVEELKNAVEDLITLESLKTYRSPASDDEIKKLEEIISGISEYYVNVGNLNGKNFESYIKESKTYKELKRKKKSVSVKNILKMIKRTCKNDIEFENSTIKTVEKDSTTFINKNKIYEKINTNENQTLVNQLKTACDYSKHVYMFEKSDRYEYNPETRNYTRLKETNKNQENEINKESKVDEDSPYFEYFGDNFAGSVDIVPQGEEEGTLYIAFRGTYSKIDARIDSDFTKLKCEFLGGKCVHKGFLKRYLQLQKDMKDIIKNKVISYKNKTKKDIKKIVVTGHSLGGALSTLAALDLQQNQEIFPENKPGKNKIPVKLITFCSPRVLSFEAYDYVVKNNILPQNSENGAVRIYRHGDVVASIPLGSMGYKHFGEVFCITNAPRGFEAGSEKSIYSKVKSYFSSKDWVKWAKSFIGYHSITGIVEDVFKLGKDKKVTMYKELF